MACEEQFDTREVLLAEAREGFGEEICCYAVVAFIRLRLCVMDQGSGLAADVCSSEYLLARYGHARYIQVTHLTNLIPSVQPSSRA